MNDEIFRILISTDNHLGFLEKDQIRGDDSFASLEEVLSTACEKKVDCMLFAGDMFHENKPSINTMHNTIQLMRQYCMGNNPVYFEMERKEDPDHKDSSLQTNADVNFNDPYQAVSLPIFSIHGNHDDPSRECGRFENSLAPMNILAAANLVNYFGKSERVENIEITPLLLTKKEVRIALYGLGAIRDERLNRMWNQRKVKFHRPSEEGKFKYFNIFVLHQNRDYGRGSKNCIHESMIPEWMDLVIWGNEHECIPSLVESLVGTYRIFQPGSSVVTSLCDGESISHPKHMGVIEIRKTREFRLQVIPYRQLRTFLYAEMTLSDSKHNLDPNDPKIEDKIKRVILKELQKLIVEARQSVTTTVVSAGNGPHASSSSSSSSAATTAVAPKFTIKQQNKVLIRLRVEHSNYPTINSTRIGGSLIEEVANPHDLIYFAKKKAYENARSVEGSTAKASSAHEAIQEILRNGQPDELHEIKIEDLVADTLQTNNKHLGLLPELEMAKALDDFVVKRFIHAISETVTEALKHVQKELVTTLKTIPVSLDSANHKNSEAKSLIVEEAFKIKKKLQESSAKGARQFKLKNTATEDRERDEGRIDMDSNNGIDIDEEETVKRKGRGSRAATSKISAKENIVKSNVSSTARGGKAVSSTATATTSKRATKSKIANKEESDEDDQEELHNEESKANQIRALLLPSRKAAAVAKRAAKFDENFEEADSDANDGSDYYAAEVISDSDEDFRGKKRGVAKAKSSSTSKAPPSKVSKINAAASTTKSSNKNSKLSMWESSSTRKQTTLNEGEDEADDVVFTGANTRTNFQTNSTYGAKHSSTQLSLPMPAYLNKRKVDASEASSEKKSKLLSGWD